MESGEKLIRAIESQPIKINHVTWLYRNTFRENPMNDTRDYLKKYIAALNQIYLSPVTTEAFVKYFSLKFPRRQFAELNDDISWFPVMRMQVLCDFKLAAWAYESSAALMKPDQNKDNTLHMIDRAHLLAGICYYCAGLKQNAERSIKHTDHPLFTSAATDGNGRDISIPDMDLTVEPDIIRWIFHDSMAFKMIPNHMMPCTPGQIKMLDLKVAQTTPQLIRDIGLYHEQRWSALLLEMAPGQKKAKISAMLLDNPSLQLEYQDLLFILQYIKVIFTNGLSRYAEVNGILNALQKRLSISDTLLANFRNIYAITAKGSGSVCIK